MASSNDLSTTHELPLDPATPVPSSAWPEKVMERIPHVEAPISCELFRNYTAPFRSPPATPPPEYSQVVAKERSWGIRLNIVIQVVGSRGDVQHFIALGSELVRHGHRVRLATHNMFEQFVRNSGLEFYPIGGDPAELMAYMVKNPGLIPSMSSLRRGEIPRKRRMVKEMLDGCWNSCLEPDTLTHEPFVADAIIANPPSFAHIHCAQALGIPVHLMFTMPWSHTRAFPHPLANLKNLQGDRGIANYVSYGVVNWMTWQGLGDVVNQWRRGLGLEEVATFEGPDLADLLKIPFTYCWSPALVPKPADWPAHIDVCGFFFRDVPPYEPPSELHAFLEAGPPPIYIGFGSIVVEDPDRLTLTISQAVEATGVRAIISKDWSNLRGTHTDRTYFIGDCPHEWLFQHVAAVVHHGGAGTTACGLKNGRPTTIVPFFGDQPFWGQMVAAAGVGPAPIPFKELSAGNLAEAIWYCLSHEAVAAASVVAERMRSEMGVRAAVKSFHRNLPLERLQCDICPHLPAAWSFNKGKKKVKLSKIAMETILSKRSIDHKHIDMHETSPIVIENRRWDPVTGGASALMGTVVDLTSCLVGTFIKPVQEIHKGRKQHARSIPDEPVHSCSSTSASAPTFGDTDEKASSSNSMTSVAKGSSGSQRSSRHKNMGLLGKAAGASARSLGQFPVSALKGMTVEIPLALTEGLRNVPRYYGEEVRNHGRVTDWKSGAVVAGKTFVWGMAEGISDIAVKPYMGAMEGGTLGAVKGLGKGVANMGAKTGAAMFGLVVYPGTGIAKSLRSSIHTGTRKKIVEARHEEGRWLVESGKCGAVDCDTIVATFEKLQIRR